MDVDECYRALGLEMGASLAEVTQAYRRLMKRWHPDRVASSGNVKARVEAHKKSQEINEAYRILEKIAPTSSQQTTNRGQQKGPGYRGQGSASQTQPKPRPSPQASTPPQRATRQRTESQKPPSDQAQAKRPSPAYSSESPRGTTRQRAETGSFPYVWVFGVLSLVVIFGMIGGTSLYESYAKNRIEAQRITAATRFRAEKAAVESAFVEAQKKYVTEAIRDHQAKVELASKEVILAEQESVDFAARNEKATIAAEQLRAEYRKGIAVITQRNRERIEYEAEKPERDYAEEYVNRGKIAVDLLKKLGETSREGYEAFADTDSPEDILQFITFEQAELPEYSSLAKKAVVLRPGREHFPHLRYRLQAYFVEWTRIQNLMTDAVIRARQFQPSAISKAARIELHYSAWFTEYSKATPRLSEDDSALLKKKEILTESARRATEKLEMTKSSFSEQNTINQFLDHAEGRTFVSRQNNLDRALDELEKSPMVSR